MILALEEDFIVLQRVWCLDEVHAALTKRIRLDFTYSSIRALTAKAYPGVESCEASDLADKRRILERIRKGCGYKAFDKRVFDFVEEGVKKVVAESACLVSEVSLP